MMGKQISFGRLVTAVAALTSLGLLSACSEDAAPSESRDSDIASVSEPTENSQSGEPAQVERPLIRPDTTKEEESRLREVHSDCLDQQGVKMIKNDDGTYKGPAEPGPKLDAAMKACLSKEPETLPARTAREDPGWKDKYRLWIKCMRSHGIQAEPTWDTPGYFSFVNGEMPTGDKEKWVKKCEAQAYVVE